jgi:hypothetical protein
MTHTNELREITKKLEALQQLKKQQVEEGMY